MGLLGLMTDHFTANVRGSTRCQCVRPAALHLGPMLTLSNSMELFQAGALSFSFSFLFRQSRKANVCPWNYVCLPVEIDSGYDSFQFF